MLRMTPQRMGGTAILFLAALIGTGSLLHPVGESKQVIADQGVYRFPGLSGPPNVTVVPLGAAARWAAYSQGTPSRLAVLMTDPDSA